MKRFSYRLIAIYNWLYNQLVPAYRTCEVEGNLPNQLGRQILYIVQEDGYPEYASMVCPCGCGRILYMNLISDERPCWNLTLHSDSSASLYPSVWRKKDCCSHFWFRQGRVQWCIDSHLSISQQLLRWLKIIITLVRSSRKLFC